MRKIIVFSSLLVFSAAGYAAQDQSPPSAGSSQPAEQQTASAQPSPSESSQQKETPQYNYAASKLMDKKVVNDQQEEIGSIKDVLVDENNQISQVVLSVGGFLGMGERLVAVPVDQVQVQDKNVVYNTTKDQLSQMPEFQYKEEKQQQAQEQQETQEQQAEAPRESPMPTPGARPSS